MAILFRRPQERIVAVTPRLSRQAMTIALLLLLGLLVSFVAWHRMHRLNPKSNPVAYWEMKGKQVYNRMPTIKIDPENAETVGALIQQAEVEDHQHLLKGKQQAMLEPLQALVADFLLARYTASTPAQYEQWMESHGYHFRPRDEFEKRYGPLSQLSQYSGTDSTDPKTVFEHMWEYPPAINATPDAICTGPGSMIISIAKANANRGFTELIVGSLGNELWMGASVSNCRMWFRPPVTEQELIARDGSVIAAEVGLIVHVPHAPRRPVFVSCFYDPDRQRWWIDDVLVTNHLGNDSEWSCSEY